MKKNLVCFIVFLFALVSCVSVPISNTPKSIPMGEWKYNFISGGIVVGDANVISEENDEHYILTMTMDIERENNVRTLSTQVTVETKSFKPINRKCQHLTINNDVLHVNEYVATFNDNDITVTINQKTKQIKIDKPFMLTGNYFQHTLIEKGCSVGSSAEADVYLPCMRLNNTINAKETIVGIEQIIINGQNENLLHTLQEYDGEKIADAYYDKNGIIRKLIYEDNLEMIIVE